MNIVVMWSGGLDSTSVLLHALKVGFDVHAHHIILDNYQGRALAEARAVCNIRRYLKDRFKPFKFSFSRLDIYEENWIGYDEVHAMHLGCTKARGLTQDTGERTLIGHGARADDCVDYQTIRYPQVIEMLATHQKSFLMEYLPPPRLWFPNRDRTRVEIWNELPKQLRDLTWSCRRPQGEDTCGQCIPCKKRRSYG